MWYSFMVRVFGPAGSCVRVGPARPTPLYHQPAATPTHCARNRSWLLAAVRRPQVLHRAPLVPSRAEGGVALGQRCGSAVSCAARMSLRLAVPHCARRSREEQLRSAAVSNLFSDLRLNGAGWCVECSEPRTQGLGVGVALGGVFATSPTDHAGAEWGVQ